MKRASALLIAVFLILSVFSACSRDEQAEDFHADDILISALSGNDTVIFVAPDGNDSASGTIDEPLATLNGARMRVRSKMVDVVTGGVTVCFRGGEYPITEGTVFTEADSGTSEHPVIYMAYPYEEVTFTGGIRIDPAKITSVTDESILSRVNDPSARDVLMQADLSDITVVLPEIYTYEKTENDAFYPVNLYIGEKRLSPARWPNADSLFGPSHYVHTTDLYRLEDDSEIVFYDDDAAERIATWSDESLEHLYMRGFFVGDWLLDRMAVREVNREDKSLRFMIGSSNDTYYLPHYEDRIFFQNIPEEIDVPGESYTDTDKRIIYFYPTDNIGNDPVIAGLYLGNPVTLDGASYLVFDGLNIEYVRSTAFFGSNNDHITIKNSSFRHSGSLAIELMDSTDIDIDRCVFTDMTSGAIRLSGGDRTTLMQANNIIHNCDIYGAMHDGVWWDQDFYERTGHWTRNAAITVFGCGCTISHNKIHESPFTVLSIECNDLIIEYNEVYDCLWETGDNGAMGYGRDASILGVVLRYNYFHDITNGVAGVGQFCFYADDGSIAPQVYGNLFVLKERVEKEYDDGYKLSPLLFNGAQYGVVTNNIVVGYDWGVRFNSWNNGTGAVQGLWTYRLYEWAYNFTNIGAPNESWFEHYKDTSWARIFDIFTLERLEQYKQISEEKLKKNFTNAFAPYNTNDVYGNVFVALNDPPTEKGMNVHDNYETADTSVFADYVNDDFTLTDAALDTVREVYPEFEELPLSEIGPVK